jgi:hypothetical protein
MKEEEVFALGRTVERHSTNSDVAQLVEHLTDIQKVMDSSSIVTTDIKMTC